jgi:hypothetical protein
VKRQIASISLALALGGCATALVPGTSREPDVIATLGKPVEELRLPDGTRLLEYPRQPLGLENWRVTLNPDGTVRGVEQLLDEPHFARVKAGMSMDDVKRELGRPHSTTHYSNLREDVVSWLYRDPFTRMFFNAHFDATGHLKTTSRSQDPTVVVPGTLRRR